MKENEIVEITTFWHFYVYLVDSLKKIVVEILPIWSQKKINKIASLATILPSGTNTMIGALVYPGIPSDLRSWHEQSSHLPGAQLHRWLQVANYGCHIWMTKRTLKKRSCWGRESIFWLFLQCRDRHYGAFCCILLTNLQFPRYHFYEKKMKKTALAIWLYRKYVVTYTIEIIVENWYVRIAFRRFGM